MTQQKHYFFCGIGGSGMLPLAMIMHSRGFVVEGSDRSLDQGRTAAKFDFLRTQGIKLYPQDGSGISDAKQIFVTSTAIEQTVPDVEAALSIGASQITRAELLSQLFNSASRNIAVGGTSGKSTTTGMVGWIFYRAGYEPTILNGAVMNNFIAPETPFASAIGGEKDFVISEVDESDGSIAHFNPRIAVLNNISFDHQPLDQLRALFRNFAAASETAILNLDNTETAEIAEELGSDKTITYSLKNPRANLLAVDISPAPNGIAFRVTERTTGASWPVELLVPGRHNVENALAALAAACAGGISLEMASHLLGSFKGIQRRLEVAGTANGITVIDDFAHNPDKISATLATLHEFPGRLLIMFQPHGYGPLRLMKENFIDCFALGLKEEDFLLMPEPIYFGGTVDRSVTSQDIVRGIRMRGRNAHALADRDACGEKLFELVKSGDRIVAMGARDDTLSDFARDSLARLGKLSKKSTAFIPRD
jgi:UDP-N-acetylmuramate--alanine ligase